MEQAPLISIIMPVYNAGVLLHTAVESVLRQSFADFELLLVDDGSTDGSAALAHELAKKDGRIRVLEQPNAGICAARNLGLQHCRGQWYTFCDDDDTMLPHALETLLVLAKSTGADVVRGGYRLLRANAAGTAVELPHPPGQAIIIHKPAGQGYLQFLQQSGPQFVWNAMYCTNRLGHLRFDETCRKGLEDFAFNAAVFQQADSAAYTPQIVYEHLERQGSTSACGNPAAVQVRLQYLPRWGARRNIPQPAPGAPAAAAKGVERPPGRVCHLCHASAAGWPLAAQSQSGCLAQPAAGAGSLPPQQA